MYYMNECAKAAAPHTLPAMVCNCVTHCRKWTWAQLAAIFRRMHFILPARALCSLVLDRVRTYRCREKPLWRRAWRRSRAWWDNSWAVNYIRSFFLLLAAKSRSGTWQTCHARLFVIYLWLPLMLLRLSLYIDFYFTYFFFYFLFWMVDMQGTHVPCAPQKYNIIYWNLCVSVQEWKLCRLNFIVL